MSREWVIQWCHSSDGCDLASTLCKYDLRMGDLLVLGWERVRRVRRGSICSELIMCGGGVPRPTRFTRPGGNKSHVTIGGR